MNHKYVIILLVLLTFSCRNESNTTSKVDTNQKQEQKIPKIGFDSDSKSEKALITLGEEMGDKKRETATITYRRQDTTIQINRNCGWFEIQKTFDTKDDEKLVSAIDNSGFTQVMGEKERQLSPAQIVRETTALNRELFYAELPFGLNSPTIRKKSIGEVEIDSIGYEKIKFAFLEENYSDQTQLVEGVLWLNKELSDIDFIAIRFDADNKLEFAKRIAKRTVEGIEFADYEVYEAKEELVLEDMATNYAEKKLTKKETIHYEDIQVTLGPDSCD